IAESERLALCKAALVVDDGLLAAIDELAFSSDHPLSARRIFTLRVSIAVVQLELQNEPLEWNVMKASWEEHSIGFLPKITDILVGVADDLNSHFALSVPSQMHQAIVDQLFRLANDLIGLVARLSPSYPLTTRSLVALTKAIADIFVYTDAADNMFTP